jgi:hypothetical protein
MIFQEPSGRRLSVDSLGRKFLFEEALMRRPGPPIGPEFYTGVIGTLIEKRPDGKQPDELEDEPKDDD